MAMSDDNHDKVNNDPNKSDDKTKDDEPKPDETKDDEPEKSEPSKETVYYNKELKGSFRNLINWRSLHNYQQTKLIKSMYIWLIIVPLTVKVFSKFGDTLIVKFNDKLYTIVLELPFSWEWFFYAAIVFTAANIIVIWKCPTLIKENRNYADFQAQGKNYQYIRVYGLCEGKESKPVEELVKEWSPETRSGIVASLTEEYYWQLEFQLRPVRLPYRIAAAIGYTIGVVLIAVVLYQNISTTIKYLNGTEKTQVETTKTKVHKK